MSLHHVFMNKTNIYTSKSNRSSEKFFIHICGDGNFHASVNIFLLVVGPPPDDTPLEITNTHNNGLLSVYYTLATVGVIASGGLLFFNIIFSLRGVRNITNCTTSL